MVLAHMSVWMPVWLIVVGWNSFAPTAPAPRAAASAIAVRVGDPPLPDTEAGRCAGAWLAMLRAGTPDAARAFETTYRSAKRLEERSVEDRVARLSGLVREFGRLTIREVADSADRRLVLVGETGNGPATLEFVLDDDGKLDVIIIESGGQGAVRTMPLTAERRSAVVEAAAKAVREAYVYPDKGVAMGEAISEALASGAYDSITDERLLAERLTADLRSVTNDRHLRVGLRPQSAESGRNDELGPSDDEARRNNWGFRECRLVEGNVGILRLDAFVPTDEAKRVADAAMGFLGRCDAIVFDLRQNGGGSPEMICYLSGYLFDEPTLLNRMIDRDGTVVGEAYSAESVAGERLRPDVPVFVVTSGRTFSGAEEFSYNLQNLRRGTIVGETTGGGAHPVRPVRLDDRFVVVMPFMRAENPVTRTNWEGTGVRPDVEAPADQALDKAIELAREKLGR